MAIPEGVKPGFWSDGLVGALDRNGRNGCNGHTARLSFSFSSFSWSLLGVRRLFLRYVIYPVYCPYSSLVVVLSHLPFPRRGKNKKTKERDGRNVGQHSSESSLAITRHICCLPWWPPAMTKRNVPRLPCFSGFFSLSRRLTLQASIPRAPFLLLFLFLSFPYSSSFLIFLPSSFIFHVFAPRDGFAPCVFLQQTREDKREKSV